MEVGVDKTGDECEVNVKALLRIGNFPKSHLISGWCSQQFGDLDLSRNGEPADCGMLLHWGSAHFVVALNRCSSLRAE